jgi:hypothetical protein
MRNRRMSKKIKFIYEKRTAIVYILLALMFSQILQESDHFALLIFMYAAMFSIYSYTEICRKYRQPRDPGTKATLKVSTETFVDWAVTTMQGELVVSGWGNRTVALPSTGVRVEREMKVKFSEYVYVVEVISGNGDAFVSLTVDGDDEFLQTVACGRSGDPEVLYTHLNTGYGTKHWLLPGFMQGIPS